MRWIALILATILALSGMAAAQTGGQFCIKAFEDRNGNGQQDAGEPVLTRGIGINLLDARGVVIQSAVLDSSPRAAVGEYCFQFLEAGQYSVVITSADYRATTPDTMTAAISESGTPTLVEYGGQRLAITTNAVTGPTASPLSQREQVAQLVVAGLGALLVIAAMVVLGAFIYLFAFRSRLRAATTTDMRRTTGSLSAVRATDTGEFPQE